jgi:NAD(P)-dependent dehydrogenase (short-subunit alcohol dehydrogenase family)|tara:strand:- start:820 stop:1581 length:762 start_codon:yes stop_codon:yes gene_type:complete
LEIRNKVIVITGGAGGIGLAIAKMFLTEDPKIIVLADINFDNVDLKNNKVIYKNCNIASESELNNLIDDINDEFGLIDIFCSNAGILTLGDEQSTNEDWNKNWDLHVMAHVFAAKKLIPDMIKRGYGYFVNTSSAAGLLSHIDSVTYSTTKHAAIGFAEWLAITYGKQGIGVSVLCPQAVKTNMTKGRENEVSALDGMMEPDKVASEVLEAVKNEVFLISPHPEVVGYFQNKANNYSRWIGGMQKLRNKLKSL